MLTSHVSLAIINNNIMSSTITTHHPSPVLTSHVSLAIIDNNIMSSTITTHHPSQAREREEKLARYTDNASLIKDPVPTALSQLDRATILCILGCCEGCVVLSDGGTYESIA